MQTILLFADADDVPSSVELSQLENQLRLILKRSVRDLRISRRDRGLVLHGQTRTFYAKQLAQNALMKASDLPIRANEIEVI